MVTLFKDLYEHLRMFELLSQMFNHFWYRLTKKLSFTLI